MDPKSKSIHPMMTTLGHFTKPYDFSSATYHYFIDKIWWKLYICPYIGTVDEPNPYKGDDHLILNYFTRQEHEFFKKSWAYHDKGGDAYHSSTHEIFNETYETWTPTNQNDGRSEISDRFYSRDEDLLNKLLNRFTKQELLDKFLKWSWVNINTSHPLLNMCVTTNTPNDLINNPDKKFTWNKKKLVLHY